jgi:hypothetical protein
MSTKFVSKNSNYMVVLRPGIEGNRAIGTHAVPGLYVKFQGGVVDIKEDSVVELMRKHPSCGTDFLEVKQDEVDPFLDERQEIEPIHTMQEIKYGHAEGKVRTGPTKLTPAMKRLIEGEAIKMLPGLLKANPKILKDIILGLAADMKEKDAPKADASTKKSEVKEETKE